MRHALTILLLWISVAGFAQPERDKVVALRMSFIQKRVELTSAEAERFWPLYNEYHDKLRALKRNLRQSYAARVNRLGEQQAEELYQLELLTSQAETDLYKEYMAKIRAVIGVTKLARLHVAEEDFKKELLNTIREKSD